MRKPQCGRVLVLGGLMLIPWAALAADPSASGAMRFAEPALASFVQTVVDASPQVQAARAALEASEAFKAAAARPLYNPELSLNAENADTDTRTLGLSQTIDWGGKRSARAAVAESERLAVEAEYLRVRWAVTVELLSGLARHQTAVKRDGLAEDRVRLMGDFATLAQRRFDAGDLNQVELDLAALAFADARMRKATAAADRAEARQQVRSLALNSPPTKWPIFAAQLPELPFTAGDSQAMVLTLPEVRAAQRRADAAGAVVELRRRERRPDPTLSLEGGQEDDQTLIGLSVSIPLPVRNRLRHQVTAATAERRQAVQMADDILRRAHARLISASERYQLAQGAWRDWASTGRVSLSRQGDQLRRLWQAGEISTTDYLVQLRQTLEVQESALDLRRALLGAWFEWLAASGRVDTWLRQGATP